MIQTKLRILFSGFCAPIAQQLKAQDITYGITEVDVFQIYADNITLLSVKGILTQTEAQKARKRLFSQIKEHINIWNK